MPKRATKKQEQQEPQVQITPRVGRSADYKTIYVNFVQSGMTPYDISLVVGENTGVFGNAMEIELKAKITMSPLEAKVVTEILLDTVQRYEKQFGEIKVAEGLVGGTLPLPEGV